MALNTEYRGPEPWLQNVASGVSNAGVQSFLSAYQTAKHENSPLYQAQVAQAQKQVQRMGYLMAEDQLNIEKERADLFDRIEGQKSLAELSATMANVKDWSDPTSLAEIDLTYSKRPTPMGKQLVTEARTRHVEAVQAKQRAQIAQEANQARLEAARIAAESRENVAGMRGGSGYEPDSATKQAKELEDARNRVDEAKKIGDVRQIEKAELYLKDLQERQAAQHPDKGAQVRLGLLEKQFKSAMDAFYQSGMSDPKLKAEMDRLQSEITTASGGTLPAAQSAPTIVPRFRPDPKTGKLVPVTQ